MTTLRDPRGSSRFRPAEAGPTSKLIDNLVDREGRAAYSSLVGGNQDWVFPPVDRDAARSRTADTSRSAAKNLQLMNKYNQRSDDKKKDTDESGSGWRRWTNAAAALAPSLFGAGANIYGSNKATEATKYAAQLQAQAAQNALDVEKWQLSQSIPYQRWMAGEQLKEAQARSGPERAMAAAAFPLAAEHFFGEGADMEWAKWAPADLPPEMTSTDPVNIDAEIAASQAAANAGQPRDLYQEALANRQRLLNREGYNPNVGQSRSGFPWRGILDTAQTVGTLAGLA